MDEHTSSLFFDDGVNGADVDTYAASRAMTGDYVLVAAFRNRSARTAVFANSAFNASGGDDVFVYCFVPP